MPIKMPSEKRTTSLTVKSLPVLSTKPTSSRTTKSVTSLKSDKSSSSGTSAKKLMSEDPTSERNSAVSSPTKKSKESKSGRGPALVAVGTIDVSILNRVGSGSIEVPTIKQKPTSEPSTPMRKRSQKKPKRKSTSEPQTPTSKRSPKKSERRSRKSVATAKSVGADEKSERKQLETAKSSEESDRPSMRYLEKSEREVVKTAKSGEESDRPFMCYLEKSKKSERKSLETARSKRELDEDSGYLSVRYLNELKSERSQVEELKSKKQFISSVEASMSKQKSVKESKTGVSSKPATPERKVSISDKSLHGDVSFMEVPDNEEALLDGAREMVKDYLSKKQESISLGGGTYMHRSNVVLIMTVDDVPLATNLSINAKSSRSGSKIRLNDASFDGQCVYTNPNPKEADESKKK